MRFEMTGEVALQDVTVVWSDEDGKGRFSDPTRITEEMIQIGEIVSGTVTGPHYEASADSLVPAFLTAIQVFDDHRTIRFGEGCDVAQAALDEECALPAGVVS